MAKAKKPKHIAVAGNIGAGKTTLTEMLSKHYKWIPNFEDVDHNPYLMDFYEDMPRWSFNLQIFFLNSRLRQLVDIQKGTETVIQDRRSMRMPTSLPQPARNGINEQAGFR
jgi:Deoxynucleoside kinases